MDVHKSYKRKSRNFHEETWSLNKIEWITSEFPEGG